MACFSGRIVCVLSFLFVIAGAFRWVALFCMIVRCLPLDNFYILESCARLYFQRSMSVNVLGFSRSMPVQTRARRLHEAPHRKKTFVTLIFLLLRFGLLFQKIWQYLRSTVDNVRDAYIEKDCRLTPGEIERLSHHKYASSSASILDDLCMQRFWNYIVQAVIFNRIPISLTSNHH